MFEKPKPEFGGSPIAPETSSPFFVVHGGLDESNFETALEPQELITDQPVLEDRADLDYDDVFDESVTEEIPTKYSIVQEQGRKPKLLTPRQLQMRALIIHRRHEREIQHARSRSFKQRIGAVVLSFGILVAGVQVIPQALGQPSIETTAGLAIEGALIDQLGGAQIDQQASQQALVDQETPDQFIIANEARFKNIETGDTFIPEQYLPANIDDPLAFIQTPEGQLYQQKALSILKAEVEVLGIKEIRMGMRWSNTINTDGSFSLAFYEPFLNYLNSYKNPTTHKAEDVMLSVGPLKDPGYPESFPAEIGSRDPTTTDTSLIPLGKLPPTGAVITPNMPYPDLINKAELWLNTVMNQVSIDYPNIDKKLQIDNEPLNPFGPNQWTMSIAWEKEELKIILSYTPNADILVNVAGTANIAGSVDIKNPPNLFKAISEVEELFKLEQKFSEQSVVNLMLNYKDQLTSVIKQEHGKGHVMIGTDYYHLTSSTPLPIKVALNGKNYEVWVDTDTLINITENLNKDSAPWKKLGSTEVTESQDEPWGPFTSPGNDPKELEFSLSRDLGILPADQESTIASWKIGDQLETLMYDTKNFTTNTDPKKMSDPSGPYISDDQAVLELEAATTGVSTVKMVNGKKVVDNSTIDNFIDQYIRAGNSGPNISTP